MKQPIASAVRIGAVLAVLFGYFGCVNAVRFVESRSRVRVSRAKTDMRTLAVGLERYRAARQAYPAMQPMTGLGLPDETLNDAKAEGVSTFASGWERAIGAADAGGNSIALPHDAEDTSGRRPYAYWTDQARYLIFSTGPDGHFTIQHPESALLGAANAIQVGDPNLLYDPSNGTVSEGDLVRFGGVSDPESVAKIYDPSNGTQSRVELYRIKD